MSNTSTTRKPTQRDNFNEIRQILVDGGYPDHLIEFIDGRLAQLDRKNSAERKPTARQVENQGVKAQILDWMEPETQYQAAEVVKTCPACEGMSVQKVSALLSQLHAEGSLSKTVDKRKNFYALA